MSDDLVERIAAVLIGLHIDPSPSVCGCYELTPEDATLVAERIKAAMRDDGIVGFIRNDAHIKPRRYTDADAEVWAEP